MALLQGLSNLLHLKFFHQLSFQQVFHIKEPTLISQL